MSNSGIEVTLQELIDLRTNVIHFPNDGHNKKLQSSGQRLTRIRGRGIEFDATREYQAGDDIRSMAWRVTARSLKPHIKIYQEEKERPVWLAVDLSPSLYFGTRCMFKSVRIIKQATFLGWSYLLKRERIGAMIASGQQILSYKPYSHEKQFLTILQVLAECSRQKPAFTEQNHLHHLLQTLHQQVRSGNMVYIFSDFFHFTEETQKLILHLTERAQVVLMFVYDPFEAEPPPPYEYFLTNGEQRLAFKMQETKNRLQYQQQFQFKKNSLEAFARKYHVGFQALRTDQKQER